MSSNPTLLWERLQDKFYRNFEGYPMQWNGKEIGQLDGYLISSAPCGGAIALTRDLKKIAAYSSVQSASTNTSILVYSGSGTLLRKLPWDNGRIRGLGWSELEQLIVVSDNGTARCYYDFEGNFNQFSLGKQAEEEGVLECKFYSTGFVALLANDQFVAINRYKEPHAELFDKPVVSEVGNGSKSSSIYSCWQIIYPDVSIGRSLIVMAVIESSLYILDGDDVQSHKLQDEPAPTATQSHGRKKKGVANVVVPSQPVSISHLSVSSNGDFIAYYNQINSTITVKSSDFQTKLADFKANTDDAIRQIEWCGNDAVCIVYDDEITLIGPFGGSLNLYFSSTVFLFPEIDGIRTLTIDKHDFFSKVSDTVVDIFKLGSTTPAAILRDCIDQLDRKSSKADENLLIIKDSLTEAVDGCIEAASLEFEPLWQKKLLRAAAFGKAAIDLYNSDKYLQISEYLRVLNNVRQFDVGILISYNQLLYLGPQKLIDRLLTRRMHQLAFQCAEYLHLSTENIYVHWAKTKIAVSNDDDDTLVASILNRLGALPGISYEDIAKTAFDEGRLELAIVLTDKEPRRDKQVPLLLTMQQDQLALDEAIRSGDANLVHYVVMMLHRKLSLANFFKLINDRPIASACFEQICKLTDNELLANFYYQDDRRLDSAEMKYKESMEDYNKTMGSTSIDAFLDDIHETRKRYQEIKNRTFEVKVLEEQTKLINIQRQLEKDYDQPFLGFTVTETISALLKISQTARAAKLKEEFKLSDKKFSWIRLQALISRRDWDALHKFATSKKSPIGYEPFYNECLKAGSKRNAALYISHCTNLSYKRRIEMCIEVDDIRRAANEATNAKDIQALEDLKKLATPAIATEINTAIADLRQK